jgi:hypothetical protein
VLGECASDEVGYVKSTPWMGGKAKGVGPREIAGVGAMGRSMVHWCMERHTDVEAIS